MSTGIRVGSTAESVADIVGCRFLPGEKSAGTYEVRLELTLKLLDPRRGTRLHLARLRHLTAWLKVGPQDLRLARFFPYRNTDIEQYAGNPVREMTATFSTDLTAAQLLAVEELRDGGEMRVQVAVDGEIFVVLDADKHHLLATNHTASGGGVFPIPMGEWEKLLSGIGYCDYLFLQIQVPRGPEGKQVQQAVASLRAAIAKSQRGDHPEAVAECRHVLEPIEQIGWGNNTPKDVVQFLKDKARTLSLEERVAAVRVAIDLFVSASHHSTLRHELNRFDANFCIAVSAALLKLVPMRASFNKRDGDT